MTKLRFRALSSAEFPKSAPRTDVQELTYGKQGGTLQGSHWKMRN